MTQATAPYPATMGTRLAECATKLGGKRALAKAAGLSEAQLFRYINGDCDIAVSKLQALANAAQVAPEWLLTGTPIIAPSARPEFDPQLLRHLTETVEEYLFEYPVTFSPKHRGQAIALAYESLRHEMDVNGQYPSLLRESMFNMLDFAAALKRTDELETYHTIITKHLYESADLTAQEQLILGRLVRTGNMGAYNGISGQMYHDRVGRTLPPQALQEMLGLIARLAPAGKTPQHWLDLGCGSGRYLIPLAKYAPHLHLHGVDSSESSKTELMTAENNGQIPSGTFKQGNLTSIPHADASMDVVYCRLSLFFLPNLEHGETMLASLKEIRRVLKPGGTLHLLTPRGKGIKLLPFMQYLEPHDLLELAQRAGLAPVTESNPTTDKILAYPTTPTEVSPVLTNNVLEYDFTPAATAE